MGGITGKGFLQSLLPARIDSPIPPGIPLPSKIEDKINSVTPSALAKRWIMGKSGEKEQTAAGTLLFGDQPRRVVSEGLLGKELKRE